MNAELLRQAHPDVQSEFARMGELLDTLAMSLRLATEAFLDERRGESAHLRGTPPATDEPYLAWEDYFIAQGALAVLSASQAAQEPTLFDAATAA